VANSINEPRKGFDLLLDALNKISFTDVTLLVLGKAENIQTENLDVRLLGNISDDKKLMEYYSLADAFIIPSREDNLPNVMLESFACGTPVIGFPIGGIKEHVIDYKTGLLAKDISSDALAECIKQFSLNHHRFNRDWIKNYANFSIFSSLYVPYPSYEIKNRKYIKLADLPGFYGTCCTIFKPELSKYVIPTWFDSHFERFEYNPDTRFRDSIRMKFPNAKRICVSYPSFVQHMNIGSAIKQKQKVNKGHKTNNFIGEDNDPELYINDIYL
jgi:hypothetical protein